MLQKALAAFLAFAILLVAQSPQATVSGAVRDPQGASIPNVEVTATNVATSTKTVVRTNDNGLYSLRALPIGNYTITAEAGGFRRYVRQGLTLSTGQNLELEITLEVGQVSDSVTISASASTLETRTSDVNQLVESKTVEDIPLGDRRMMNIIGITGAAVFINYDSGGKPNFSLAGGRTQSQNFFLDGGGIQNMRLGIGQVDSDPPVESVQEVKVLTNSYSAEYGGSAGGVVIATSKSGTNELHGAAYEYFRNEKLDAANFFAPWRNNEKVRAPLRYNVFGATVGGPVRIPKLYNGKDKTFFYFAYEGSRRRDGFVDVFSVPTAEQQAGDFSRSLTAAGAVIPIYDPSTNRVQGTTTVRDLFPGNRIPTSRIDPVGAKLASFYPLPNRPADNLTGANNYSANYVQKLTRNYFFPKIDHNWGDKDKFSFRYLYNSDNLDFTAPIPEAAADTRNPALRHQQFYYGSWTRIFTPKIINEFRFTYANRINHATSQGLDEGWPEKIGIKGVPNVAFPQVTVAGMRNLGTGAQERRQFPIQQFQWINNLTLITGRHQFKLGFEARPSFNFEINRPLVSGAFNFANQATGQPGVAASGLGMASLLVGFPQGFSARTTQELDRRSWYISYFVQDDFTVTKDLTLNIGVRFETDTPIYDINNRMNGFDLNAINPVSGTPGVVKFMGVNGFRTKPYNTDWNNFGPRIGFAWKMFGSKSTVMRGGYGAFFAHPFDAGAPTAASLGYELSAAINSPDNGVTAPFFLRNGVPGLSLAAPVLNDSFGAVRVGVNPTVAATFFEEGRRTGYSHQFNLGIQREVGRGFIFEVSGLGNLSRKLPSANLSLNQVTPDRLTPTSTQRDRPFPQFSNVTINLPSLGVSAYYAMLVRAEKRFSNGFNVLSTYTFSKFLNNTNEGGAALGAEGSVYSNFYNRRADYGPSENDIRHRLTWSSVYELPFGKGRRFLAENPVRVLVGGWSMGSILTLQSGAPFTVTTQVNSVFSAAGALRADVSGNPNLDSPTLNRWFDTSVFSQPAPARFGNQGVNILRADGVINLDLSLLRNFNFGEEKKLQLRAETFNITNHPNFGVPGRVFGAPGFGIVSSAGAARRVQLGLRFVY